MCVESAFGVLKGRWRIIIKRIDVPLWHMVDIVVVICIVLYNIYRIDKVQFDVDWIGEDERKLEGQKNRSLKGRLKNEGWDRNYR